MQTVVGSNEKSWEGAKPEVGAVLGLKSERLNNKVTFEVFREKLAIHVLSEFRNGRDILPAIKKMTDPRVTLRSRSGPKELTDEEKKSSIEVELQKQRIKPYIEREITARTNMDKLYGVIKGQCSESCIGIIENDKDHDDKD